MRQQRRVASPGPDRVLLRQRLRERVRRLRLQHRGEDRGGRRLRQEGLHREAGRAGDSAQALKKKTGNARTGRQIYNDRKKINKVCMSKGNSELYSSLDEPL